MVPPSASSTDHLTVVSAVPVTWAVNFTDVPGVMLVSPGAVATTTVWPAAGTVPLDGAGDDPPQAAVKSAVMASAKSD